MSASGQRWWWLLAAVAAVAAALWMLQRTPSPDAPTSGGATSSKERVAGLEAKSVGHGVGRRDVSVPGHGYVRAQVVDEDGTPISEGQVVLHCLNADGSVDRLRDGVLALDEDGRFEGPGCRGQVCPRLRHPYMVAAEPWSLRSGSEQVLEVRPLARLWGRVVDPSGAPVAGAQLVVVISPEDADDPSAVLPVVTPRTSSDVDGEFSLAMIERPPCDPCQQAEGACPDAPLPVAERVLVTARAPGWAPGELEVDLEEAGSPEEPIEVVVRTAEAAITGTLTDGEGAPLPRAFVLARSESSRPEQHRSDATDGVFAFDALGEGPYTIRAIQDGRELVRREGIEPGAVLELGLAEVARDVEVSLVDAQGRPWPDVQVEGGPFARQRSDAEGLVRAQRVIPGAYILRVRPRGASAQAHDLEIPEAPEARNPSPMVIELSAEP